MIFYFLIKAVLGVLAVLTIWLPVVDQLPWGVDNYLADGVAYYKLIGETIPLLGLMLDLTTLYLAFKLLLIVLKFFLGSRLPVHNDTYHG